MAPVDLENIIETFAANTALLKELQSRLINTEVKINFLLAREVPLTASLIPENGDQKWGSRTYAQHGDDIIALALLDNLGIAKPSYIDIGAHHPFNISNTALMYSLGGRGVNVEPNPVLFEAFPVQRPQDVNLNIGVSDEAGRLTFHCFDERSGLNTFSPERAKWVEENTAFRVRKTFEVEVQTVAQILDTHCAGKAPDFMSLDVEGLDARILASMDFERHRPAVICVEMNSAADSKGVSDNLMRHGYRLAFRSVVNLFFVDTRRERLTRGGL